jgi:hypothetical protein
VGKMLVRKNLHDSPTFERKIEEIQIIVICSQSKNIIQLALYHFNGISPDYLQKKIMET